MLMNLQVGSDSAGLGWSLGSGLWALAASSYTYVYSLDCGCMECVVCPMTHSGSETEGTTINCIYSSHGVTWEHRRASQTLQVHFRCGQGQGTHKG